MALQPLFISGWEQLSAYELGLNLERGIFATEIKMFNGCRDFYFSMRSNRIGLAICQSFR